MAVPWYPRSWAPLAAALTLLLVTGCAGGDVAGAQGGALLGRTGSPARCHTGHAHPAHQP